IFVDGVLDEADWGDAPIASGFVQNDPREGEPATFETEVRILHDDEYLYVGALAHDDEPDRIIVNDLTRDFETRAGDVFGIVLDTFHDQRNGYMFETNPAGAKFDAQFANEGREFNGDWDGVWHVASRIIETGWVVEIAIPFKTLRFADAPSQTWGANFLRRTRRLNEDSYWAPLPRIHRFTRVSLAGTLGGLDGLTPKRDIKITPYAKGDVTDGADTSSSGAFDAGVDAKLAVGSGLRLDLTLNTDFSQVEADVQQINLTRFSLFFPEKRDFFLENSGIFRFGPPADQRVQQFQASFGASAAPSNLRGGQSRGEDLLFFFSRRIGLSDDGSPIPVVGGGRLTGRVGDYEVGFLNMQTGDEPELVGESLAANGDNFTVARVRRNLFSNSDFGVMFINRENMSTDHYNRGLGADANFRLSPEVDVNGYIAKTATRGLSGQDLAGRLAWSYDGRLFQISNAISTLQDNFNPEVGFAPRIGVKRSSNFFGYHYRPSWWGDFLREINPHFELEYFTDQNGVVVSRYFNMHVSWQMQNGGYFEGGLNTNLEQPQDDFPIHPDVTIPAGFYTFDEWFGMLFSDTSRTFSGNFRASTGDFYSGTRNSLSLGGVLKLGEQFRAQVSWSYNDVDLLEGAFTTHLVTTRFAYNFSTRMFLNGLIQYNNVTSEWSSNIRFNLIHRPLSDFFIVYNDLRDEMGLVKDRALIVKYTQLFSF
ncbi:MAG TPA: DUF5916 domain-containing protein, partial [Vicinamibacteria bacterium]|nr:DUF5916 domain-containing protein [Vicinamibacteria bacterium]